MIRYYRPYAVSLMSAALLTLALCQYQCGFALIFVLLVWVFCLPYCFYQGVKNPEIRWQLLMRFVIWLSAAVIIVVAHVVQHTSKRQIADDFVRRIEAFAETQHRYPSSMQELGIPESQLNDQLGLAYYSFDPTEGPRFVYATTFEPFSTFSYDFLSSAWAYYPD